MSAPPIVRPTPQAEWTPLPRQGCVGVLARVLLNRRGVVVANLMFAAHASIDEHAAPYEIDVVCVQGEGFVSVGDAVSRLRAGECVTWPSGLTHRLWTEDKVMETLMVEHHI